MAKVLYVCESIAPFVTGGMQEVARRHIQYLRDAGHEVIGLHSRIEHEQADAGSDNMIRVPWPGENDKFCWRYPGKYTRQLRLYSRKIVEWVIKEKPDVIYAEGPVVAAVFNMPDRPPIIFHPHGLEVFQLVSDWQDRLRLYPLKRLIAEHCRRSELVISQGGRLSEILPQKAGVDPDRVRKLPNSFPGPLGQAALTNSGHFLFVGRMEKRKGLASLLEVFAALPHLQLDVVGAEDFVGATDNVRFHGVVRDRAQLNSIYRDAHTLVVPSLAEGMPTVILEAMSQGTPVIATDVGASADLVINGETGWCIEPGSSNFLKDTIEQAASINAADYTSMSGRCIDLIRDHYSEDVVKTMLCSLVDEVIYRFKITKQG